MTMYKQTNRTVFHLTHIHCSLGFLDDQVEFYLLSPCPCGVLQVLCFLQPPKNWWVSIYKSLLIQIMVKQHYGDTGVPSWPTWSNHGVNECEVCGGLWWSGVTSRLYSHLLRSVSRIVIRSTEVTGVEWMKPIHCLFELCKLWSFKAGLAVCGVIALQRHFFSIMSFNGIQIIRDFWYQLLKRVCLQGSCSQSAPFICQHYPR